MHQKQLLPMVRTKVREMLGGYLQTRELKDMNSYLVCPSLEDKQGVLGALKLGIDAWREEQ